MDGTAIDDGDFGDFQTSDSASIPNDVSNVNVTIIPGSMSNSSFSTLSNSSSSSSSSSMMTSSVSTEFQQSTQDDISSSSLSSSSSSKQSPTTPIPHLNIFEADQFKFDEFINKFEQHLEQIFVSNNPVHHSLTTTTTTSDETGQLLATTKLPPTGGGDLQNKSDQINLSYNESIPAIRSQEDIINDCPIWWNLTGSFNSKPPLTFTKSKTFKCYIDALAESCHRIQNHQQKTMSLNRSENNNQNNEDTNCELEDDIYRIKRLLNEKKKAKLTSSVDCSNLSYPANFNKNNLKNKEEDEEEIANDLDMHSLIIDSVEHSFRNGLNHQQDIVASADRAIEEINTIMNHRGNNDESGNDVDVDNDDEEENQKKNTRNALLSLNAASLLDAALQNWQQSQSQYSHISAFDEDYEDDDEEQCHSSLPAHLNNSQQHSPIPNYNYNYHHHQKNRSQDYHSLATNNQSDHCEEDNNKNSLSNSLLSLKASNIVLSSKLSNSIDSKPPPPPQQETKPDSNNQNSSLANKLQQLSIVQLNELYIELEQIIQLRSEVLIQELALRDELEFEKELKNSFVSLLLSVQNKRRHYTSSSGMNSRSRRSFIGRNKPNTTFVRRNSNDSIMRNSGSSSSTKTKNNSGLSKLTFLGASIKESLFSSQTPTPVYLTTVIPYRKSINPIDVPTLQMLIKLLTALNEDSSTVPALLTEYILKVICP